MANPQVENQTPAHVQDLVGEGEKVKKVGSQWQNPSFRRQLIYSVYLTISFGMLGCVIGQRGPTFIDLQIITNTDVGQASAFFTAVSVGYLLGSLIGGMAYDKCNKTLIMFGIMSGTGITTGAIPFCPQYAAMIVIQIFNGIFSGAVDTCANAELFRTWGSKGRSVMQAAHFAFALGGVISPLYTKPFLSPVQGYSSSNGDLMNITEVQSPGLYSAADLDNNFTNMTVSSSDENPTTSVFYAFLITAVLTSLSSFPFLLTWCQTTSCTKKRQSIEEPEEPRKIPLSLFILTLSLICFTFFLYCAIEDTFAALLMTFTVKGQMWTKVRGTELTSAFWASFAGGRLSGAILVKHFQMITLLFLSCIGLLLFQVGFLLSAHYFWTVGIWMCSVGTGLSIALFFPVGVTWIDEELLKLNGKVSSAILIAGSSGTMLNPILVAYLMENVDANWYSYVFTAQSAAFLMMFSLLFFFARFYMKKRNKRGCYSVEVTVNEGGPSVGGVQQA